MAAASKASLPAGATVGAPESRADFETMARIDAQIGITNDPRMQKRGLEERVKEMAAEAAEGNATIAREPGGALVAMVILKNETDATVYVDTVGTLPSHARRGYAAGLLAHALLTKRKRAPLATIPGNEAAIACYVKLGFVHTAEYASYNALHGTYSTFDNGTVQLSDERQRRMRTEEFQLHQAVYLSAPCAPRQPPCADDRTPP